jgi:hypothetical protein
VFVFEQTHHCVIVQALKRTEEFSLLIPTEETCSYQVSTMLNSKSKANNFLLS